MLSMKNKVVILTGAAGGMGQALARSLAAEGARLALLSTNREKLDALAAELPGEHLTLTVDVRDENQVRTAFDTISEMLGQPYALVNLAGLSIPAKLYDMSEADFDRTMDVNVKGTFLCCKHFARIAPHQADSIILNVSSMAAIKANGNAPAYCTAKAAVNMLSAGLTIQLKELGIRVTTVNPGGTDTPFWGTRKVDRSKLMTAQDVAEVMHFILTRESRVLFHEVYFESFLNI